MNDTTGRTPVIALVGRTNVGKSTMFNRLLETKKAIMSDVEGTTTDINFGHCHWRGEAMTVIDTAGLDLTKRSATADALKRQAMAAMSKADIIFFMVDVAAGVMPQDLALAKHLRTSKTPVVLVANKADNPRTRRLALSSEWARLGVGDPIAVSAANGSGVGDLLDLAYRSFKERGIADGGPLPEPEVRVAIMGRPNVGKSTLLNALAGEERVIVSEVAHTTKEPQDTLVSYTDRDGATHDILLVDTVGIRKKTKVGQGIERIGVSMSIEELRRSDVALLIVDAEHGVELQEKRLAGLIERKWSGAIIVINKWDRARELELGTAEEYAKSVAKQLPFYSFAPVMFISAMTGDRVGKLLDRVLEVQHQRTRTLTTEELAAFVERLKKKHHAIVNSKSPDKPKVYGISQTGTAPPTFTVVVRKKETAHPSFLRFIENRLREDFGFVGTPITVDVREIKTRPKG